MGPFDPCQGLRSVSNQTLLNSCLQPGACAHTQLGSLVGDSGTDEKWVPQIRILTDCNVDMIELAYEFIPSTL